MLYKDWKKEADHHRTAIAALEQSQRYRVNDHVEAIVYLSTYEPGFQMTLYSVSGDARNLATLSHGDLISLTNLHEAFVRYVENENPLNADRALPDPATWNRPKL